MTVDATMRPSMTHVIAVYGCFGLTLGVLATFGWRYLAPYGSPDYAPIAPELIPPGQEQGFMIEVDHEKYISGPSWLPTAITLPLICTLLGALAGVLVATLAHRRISLSRSRFIRLGAAGLAATGILIGFTSAIYSAKFPPRLQLELSMAPSTDPYEIENAPTHFDLGSPYLIFPIAGCALGILAAPLWIQAVRRPTTAH